MNAFIAEYGEFIVMTIMGLSIVSGLVYILNALVVI